MPDITISKLRGGLSVSWKDPDTGKRRRYQLKARTRKEAEAEARDVYLSKTRGPVGSTVADIWEAYVAHLGKRPTARTMRSTGKAVLDHFGHLRPDQINDQDCRSYTALRFDLGKSTGGVHTELGHLRSALRWAEKRQIIERAPHIEQPPKPDSNVEPLSDEQISLILANVVAPHARLAVVLLLTTGGRIGAILDLEWRQIDFERGVINLRKEDGVKRKGRAVVPMNRMARAALESAYQVRTTDWVVEYAGGPITSIRTAYTSALRRAKLSGVTIHQIRHTVAVRMLVSGQPIEVVSQYLGHSNIQITHRIYARFLPEHLSEAAEVLNFDVIRKA